MSPNQMAGYLRSFGYSDGDLVDAICSQCIDSLLASMMRKDYSGFLNNLHSTNQTAFDDLCTQLSVPGMLPLNDKITMIISSSSPANSAGILSNGGHLQCSEILSIFDWMFVLESSLSNNQLDSVNGVKACYKGALGEAELAAAMEHTLGYSGMWDRIFAEEPGTEDEYIHHIRQNQSALFLYHALLVLNDYGYLDNIAYNLNGVYIGPWLDAVKSHFGEGYYNTYITKLLPGNYTSSWAYKLNEQHIYGSSRIGLIQRDLPLIKQKYGDQAWNYITTENDTAFVYHYTTDSIKYRNRGEKRYELSNHLGNVLAVITDRRIQACETGELMHYEAQIVQVTDYYPFGSIVESRSWKGDYRYGFNGQEGDDEVSGSGNSYTAEYWQYDSRLGRRWNVDPVYKNSSSNYSVFSNKPTIMVDPLGNSDYYTKRGTYLGSDGTSNTDIMVVTKFSVIIKMWWTNRKALRKNEYVVHEGTLDNKDYFLLPPESHREQMRIHFDEYDPEVGNEIGGKGVLFEDRDGNTRYEHFRVEDGALPKDGEAAEISYGRIHKKDRPRASEIVGEPKTIYFWHSHPKSKEWYKDKDGKWVDRATPDRSNIGNTDTHGEESITTGGPGPSKPDYDNAEKQNRPNNFVLYKSSKNLQNGNVDYYNNKRESTRMSLRFFLDTKAKTVPNEVQK